MQELAASPTRSLAFRLVLSATAWSAVALVAAGVLLTELYRTSLERTFDERLEVYQKTIIGLIATTPEEEPLAIGSLGEPRFLLPLTGWYWSVRDADGGTVSASPSLFGDELESPAAPRDGSVGGSTVTGPSGEPVRVLVRRVVFGDDRDFDVMVTGSTAELRDDIAGFRLRVFGTLAVFALGLVLAAVVQVRLALKPLDAMRASLAAIREGRAERLEGAFPREIAPLAGELNALIETNGAIVERARAHVGNLAHALKTPLSVMLNEARGESSPLAGKVGEQVAVMRAEVDRYLDRARMAAGRRVVGSSAEVMRSVEAIAKVLARAYPDKALAIDASGPADLKVRAERRDLDELVGNLMDNAAKFGAGRIRVRAGAEGDADAARPMVALTVEDDGPGLPPESYAEALGRGRRLDETVPGSGLGLSIVEEIVESYGGRLILGRSDLGGLIVTVRLPRS
ncbi:MAG TPA: HAMP domain-containing sensor histidine kinase [Methylomirabilota bacterium]|nr:HAMP domain-containing sensor histidine kinase [Methylomirabilota bacterium]